MKFNKSLLVLALVTTLSACDSDDDNNAPIFSSATYDFTVDEDSSVTGALTATDSDNDELTFITASATSNGVFALNADGSFTYTPADNFNGTDIALVQVSDGDLSNTAELTFNITAINDAPSLVTTNVTVTSLTVKTGTIEVLDIDGDEITFAVINEPETGEISLDTNTGEFTYTTERLTDASPSFTASYTDGVIDEAIEVEISLAPSFITNQDKANYYYTSEQSHLKRAEKIANNIIDDTLLDSINSDLAIGYLLAGFTDESDEIFDSISVLDTRAIAYKNAALQLDALLNFEQSAALRAKAISNYNAYVGEKGVNNMTSADANFYQSVVAHYVAAGQKEEASALNETIQVFANEALDNEGFDYSIFVNAAAVTARAIVEAYVLDQTDSLKEQAEDAIVILAELAKNIPAQEAPSWSDYAGELYEKSKATYLNEAVTLLYKIDSQELTKKYLHYNLALFGIVDLDEDYPNEASIYATANASEAAYYAAPLAGVVEAYYPDLDTNPVLEILIWSYEIDAANATILTAKVINDINSGTSVDTVLKTIVDENTDLSRRDIYNAIAESYTRASGAALILNSKGKTTEALEVLNFASELMASETFVSESWYLGFTTGYAGCARLTHLFSILGGDAKAQAGVCEDMVNTYFTTAVGTASTSDIITAHIDQFISFYYADDFESAKNFVPQAIAEINNQDNNEDIAEKKLYLAPYLMKLGLLTEAMTTLNEGLDLLEALTPEDVDSELLIDIVELLNDETLSLTSEVYVRSDYVKRYSFSNELARKAGQLDGYQEVREQFTTRLTTMVNDYTARILKLSDIEIYDNMELMIEMNFVLGNDDKVLELIEHDVNADADKLTLQAFYASMLATKDSFSGTSIATVDTDNDGMPNFFLPGTTEEAILASGLTADDDSDNDGIPDAEDSTPLGN